jgi:hypothetical protein
MMAASSFELVKYGIETKFESVTHYQLSHPGNQEFLFFSHIKAYL